MSLERRNTLSLSVSVFKQVNGETKMTNQAKRVLAEQALTVYLTSKGQNDPNSGIVDLLTDVLALLSKYFYSNSKPMQLT